MGEQASPRKAGEPVADAVGRIHELLTELLTEAVGELHRHLTEAGSNADPPQSADPAIQAADPRTGHETAAAADERAVSSPAERCWEELRRLRPELDEVQPDPLDLQVRLALRRVSTAKANELASRPGLLPAIAGRGQEAETEDKLACQVRDLVEDFPAVRRAMASIGVIASYSAGLGRIDLKAALGPAWLRPFATADFPEFWSTLCEMRKRVANQSNLNDRRVTLLQLDAMLRTIVPVRALSEGKVMICPPDPDSPWMSTLTEAFDEIRAWCGQVGFETGHVERQLPHDTAVSSHHLDDNKSFRQHVPQNSPDRYKVLWPLQAWAGEVGGNGRPAGGHLLGVQKAMAVFAYPE